MHLSPATGLNTRLSLWERQLPPCVYQHHIHRQCSHHTKVCHSKHDNRFTRFVTMVPAAADSICGFAPTINCCKQTDLVLSPGIVRQPWGRAQKGHQKCSPNHLALPSKRGMGYKGESRLPQLTCGFASPQTLYTYMQICMQSRIPLRQRCKPECDFCDSHESKDENVPSPSDHKSLSLTRLHLAV